MRYRIAFVLAVVVGAGVTGRLPTAAEEPSAADAHDDEELTAAVVQPADRLLTHPPRPRKKKRR